MMTWYADLHIHSRYSRATSKGADLEQFSLWARKKGLTVVGTGDFTHPVWREELRTKLVPAEPGLFRLRPGIEKAIARELPASLSSEDHGPARFILQVEISTIYKAGDRTRKVHHVIFVPGLKEANRLVRQLERIGNLKSDGRPILGLDSRDLLEIVLSCGEGCYLIPAHIWTPWFSAMGSKSGFDTIDDCYRDLAPHIFAVETGLSSDPPMNWRVRSLDRFRLVSNSDAHSPSKLAREACVFRSALDYFAMAEALRTGKGYGGTLELFPQEGKYHLDGHRKCGVCLKPEETQKQRGLCPGCGKPVTVGVMNRVMELASRPEGKRPRTASPFRSLIPLPEVLSELLGVGPATKSVAKAYEDLLAQLGPELHILQDADLEDMARRGLPPLATAVGRMREGQVIRDPGYDGEYGTIRLFDPGELPKDRKALLPGLSSV